MWDVSVAGNSFRQEYYLHRMSSNLIAFSGIDGAGKSTQIDILIRCLRIAGKDPVYVWSRGGYTPGVEAAKRLVRRAGRGRIVPPSGRTEQRAQAFAKPRTRRLWLALAMLDLIVLYAVGIRWWRWRERPVICDRYLWDTLIDFRLNFPTEDVERWLLWRVLRATAPKPDVAFLLLVPVDESVRRGELKHEPFPDSRETLAQRLDAYTTLILTAGWIVIDCIQPVETVADEIANALQPLVGETEAAASHAH